MRGVKKETSDGNGSRNHEEANVVVPVVVRIVLVHVEFALVVVEIQVQIVQLLAKCGIRRLWHCPWNARRAESDAGPLSPPAYSTEFLLKKAC